MINTYILLFIIFTEKNLKKKIMFFFSDTWKILCSEKMLWCALCHGSAGPGNQWFHVWCSITFGLSMKLCRNAERKKKVICYSSCFFFQNVLIGMSGQMFLVIAFEENVPIILLPTAPVIWLIWALERLLFMLKLFIIPKSPAEGQKSSFNFEALISGPVAINQFTLSGHVVVSHAPLLLVSTFFAWKNL